MRLDRFLAVHELSMLAPEDLVGTSDDQRQDPVQGPEGSQKEDRKPGRCIVDPLHQGRHVGVQLEHALDSTVAATYR